MLNEAQRNELDGYLKFPLEDIMENEEVSPEQALTAMQALYEIFNSGRYNLYNQYRQDFNNLDILVSIDQIIKIYKHPYPQNRTTNYPYYGAPSDNTMIVYKDRNGNKAYEKKGLLCLSARNDDTAAPVTKADVIRFIRNILEQKIELLKKQVRINKLKKEHQMKFSRQKLKMQALQRKYKTEQDSLFAQKVQLEEYKKHYSKQDKRFSDVQQKYDQAEIKLDQTKREMQQYKNELLKAKTHKSISFKSPSAFSSSASLAKLEGKAEENYALAKAAIYKKQYDEAIDYLFLSKKYYKKLKNLGVNCEGNIEKIKKTLLMLKDRKNESFGFVKRPTAPSVPNRNRRRKIPTAPSFFDQDQNISYPQPPSFPDQNEYFQRNKIPTAPNVPNRNRRRKIPTAPNSYQERILLAKKRQPFELSQKETFLRKIKHFGAIFAGGIHSLFITKKGKVFGCGFGVFIGNRPTWFGFWDPDNKNRYKPIRIKVPGNEKIIDISTGRQHSLFLSEKGSVFGCGYNEHGELGLGDKKWRNKPTRIKIPGNKKIIAISAGSNRSFFMTTKNNVFACGINYSSGYFGGKVGKIIQIKIPNNERIIDVVCQRGYFSGCSFFLTAHGNVFGYGYLNHITNKQYLSFKHEKPVQIPFSEKIIAISAGSEHNFFLTARGSVFACGGNYYGQLGFEGKKDRNILTKVKIPTNEKIVEIAAGRYHSLFLTAKGTVFGCGKNSGGRLGFGGIKDITKLTQIKTPNNEKIVAISAGGDFSLFLTENGNVFGCGEDNYGQLGMDKKILSFGTKHRVTCFLITQIPNFNLKNS